MRTAGILLREGATRDVGPSLQVLEIGHTYGTRKDSDLLPYLPEFRKFFASLPNRKSSMKLKAASIPLSDVQCLTQTLVKVCSTKP